MAEKHTDFAVLIEGLVRRREELGMSMGALAERAGVSWATVQRVLSGRDPNVSMVTILKIATVLGVRLTIAEAAPARQLMLKQASAKAEFLTAQLQATSALEAQAVGSKARSRIKRQMIERLLAGSTRTLWAS